MLVLCAKLWRHFLLSTFGWFITQGPQGHRTTPNSRQKNKISQILFCLLVLWTDHTSLPRMIDGNTVDFRVKCCVAAELWTWAQVCTNKLPPETQKKGWTTLFSPLGEHANSKKNWFKLGTWFFWSDQSYKPVNK